MGKIFKKLSLGMLALTITLLVKLPSVNACSISVSAPSSAVVGNSFTVTTTVSSGSGSWEYALNYDSSKVRLVSGSLRVVGVIGDRRSSSYTFTALKSGTATFRISNGSVLDYNTTNECLSSSGSASVSMKTQAEIEESYSRNNNLSELTIAGAELSPAFNADTLEYTASLPVDTEKATITATAADSTATVTGAGELDVVDGINKIEITVTAQHGEVKTYVINLTVLEQDPIKTTINNKKYTVVRKSKQIDNIPYGYVEKKIKIDKQEVSAYYSDITKETLVVLKDEKGNMSFFVYDSKAKSFSSFIAVSSASANISILDSAGKTLPLGFTKSSFEYDKKNIDAYRFALSKEKRYYLVYAQNLETGNKGFYLYDKKDNTFQMYYSEMMNLKDYVILGFSGLFILLILISIIRFIVVVATKKEKKIEKLQKKINKLQAKIEINDEEDIDTLDNVKMREEKKEEVPVIRKVEEDEYVIPKKTRKQKTKELEEARKKLNNDKPSYRRISLEDDDE